MTTRQAKKKKTKKLLDSKIKLKKKSKYSKL